MLHTLNYILYIGTKQYMTYIYKYTQYTIHYKQYPWHAGTRPWHSYIGTENANVSFRRQLCKLFNFKMQQIHLINAQSISQTQYNRIYNRIYTYRSTHLYNRICN